MNRILASTFAVALFATATVASALPPPSVAGAWSLQGNRDASTLTLVQAAGTTPCRWLTGTFDDDKIDGIYCPKTGQIEFLRYQASSGRAFQIFRGSVAQVLSGTKNYFAGSFVSTNPVGGAAGNYPFFAIQK